MEWIFLGIAFLFSVIAFILGVLMTRDKKEPAAPESSKEADSRNAK